MAATAVVCLQGIGSSVNDSASKVEMEYLGDIPATAPSSNSDAPSASGKAAPTTTDPESATAASPAAVSIYNRLRAMTARANQLLTIAENASAAAAAPTVAASIPSQAINVPLEAPAPEAAAITGRTGLQNNLVWHGPGPAMAATPTHSLTLSPLMNAVTGESSPTKSAKDVKESKLTPRSFSKICRWKMICRERGWLCPLSGAPFHDPCWFGDGFTYEKSELLNWLRLNTASVVGPTGAPILVKDMMQRNNLMAYISLQYESSGEFDEPKDPLTKAPFYQPVCLVRIRTQSMINSGSTGSMTTFEAQSLVEKLKETWGHYETNGTISYVGISFDKCDLSRSHTLVPNRIFMPSSKSNAEGESKLPKLPVRGAPTPFDDVRTSLLGIAGIVDFDDAKQQWYEAKGLETTLPNRYDGDRYTFSNICAVGWKLSSVRTSKIYRFENCHFKKTTFKGLYWPAVFMHRCRFFDCIWEDCFFTEVNISHHLANEFAKCTVIMHNDLHQSPEDLKDSLVGYQHTQQNRADAHAAITILKPIT